MLSFTVVDLFAAAVNAFNGGLLAQRPNHYRRKYFTAVGITRCVKRYIARQVWRLLGHPTRLEIAT